MSDFDSVRSFAKDINESEPRLDVLINNAGLYMGKNSGTNKNGIELTFASNHLGGFLLTILLLKLLKKSAPSRIIIVSSSFAFLNWSDFTKLDYNNLINQNTLWLYNLTKRSNALFMRELDNRLNGTKIVVNALHPGTVITNIVNSSNIFTYVLIATLAFYYKTAKQGAQTQINLAVNPDLETVSGQFWVDCFGFNKVFRGQKELEYAEFLWKKSEELVKLTDEEKHILKEL